MRFDDGETRLRSTRDRERTLSLAADALRRQRRHSTRRSTETPKEANDGIDAGRQKQQHSPGLTRAASACAVLETLVHNAP